MELIQLKYFVGITDSPTMLQAARAMNVSQSTLSVSMKKLEEELGVKLFARSGRRLVLTGEGERFLEGAARILDELEGLKQSLRAGQGSPGAVTVAANATDFAVEAIALYRELAPARPVRPIRSNAAGIRSLLAAREADLALTLAPADSPHLTSVLLFREPMELLVSPRDPLRRAGSVSLGDLEGRTLVTMGQGHDLRKLFDAFLQGAGVHPGELIEVSDEEALSGTVARGLGVTFIPAYIAGGRSGLVDRPVFSLPIREPECSRSVYLLRRSPPQASPEAAEFCRFLLEFSALAARLGRCPTAADVGGGEKGAGPAGPGDQRAADGHNRPGAPPEQEEFI